MVTQTAFQYLLLGLLISIAVNVLLILALIGLGIAKPVVQRIRRRWKYKTGKYVNVLFLRRNHVSHELFVKKEDDGSFLVDDKRYTVNPYCTFIHDGIPTQINKEGDAEAFNIYDNSDARNMSTAELENIIMNNEVNNLAAMLKKMLPLILIAIFLIAAFIGASLWLQYKVYDVIVSKHALENLYGLLQNSTAVMPR